MKFFYTFFIAILLFSIDATAQTLHEVTISGLSFEPDEMTIQEGDTVMWINSTSTYHTTTSGTNCESDGIWDSELDPDGSAMFMYVFDEAGDFPYYCIPHCEAGMTGEITVEESTAIQDVKSTARGVQVKPNPAINKTTIYVNSDALTGTYRIKVYNYMGSKAMEDKGYISSGDGFDIDLTSFQSGIYLYEITGKLRGELHQYVGKILVQ